MTAWNNKATDLWGGLCHLRDDSGSHPHGPIRMARWARVGDNCGYHPREVRYGPTRSSVLRLFSHLIAEVITADGLQPTAQARAGHTRKCLVLFSLLFPPQAPWKPGQEPRWAEERSPFHVASLAARHPLAGKDPP